VNTTTEDHLLLRTKASGKSDCVVQGQILHSVEGVQGCSGREAPLSDCTMHIWLMTSGVFLNENVDCIRISSTSTPLIWRAIQTNLDNVDC